MRVCMPRGYGIRERGSESEISGTTWRQIWVIRHPKDRHVFFSSRTSSIVCKMCLHRKKGVRITMAYRRVAFLRVSSLRQAWSQIFVTTIFAKNRCIGAKAPMLIWEWDLSLRCGLVPNKSCKNSMLGASSGKGTPETGRTGSPITELIS
jgi:hypothetical protein